MANKSADKWTSGESVRRANLIIKRRTKPLTARETIRLAELDKKLNRILRRGGLYDKKTRQHEGRTPK